MSFLASSVNEKGPIRLEDGEVTAQPPQERSSTPKRIKRTVLLLTLLGAGYFVGKDSTSTQSTVRQPKDTDLPEWMGAFKHHQQGGFQGVDWHECHHPLVDERENSIRDRFSCAQISVPLDYHDRSLGNSTVAAIKFATSASKKDRLGSVFTNPGGPGGSGFAQIARAGPDFSLLTGGRYDFIGFDPRGIAKTRPTFRCFPSAAEEYAYALSVAEKPSVYWHGNDSASLAQLKRETAEAEAVDATTARHCETYDQGPEGEGAGRYMSTAHVVRDIDLMATLLEGDKPINFWGFSYGTTVGTYLVSMFPDRVGRVAIDGVMAVERWFTEAHDRQTGRWALKGMEAAWENFLVECAKAGPACALADSGDSATDIGNKIDALLENLYWHPLPVPQAKRPGIMTTKSVTQRMFQGLYKPRTWPSFASDLAAAIAGDGAPILNAGSALAVTNTSIPAVGAWAGTQVGVSDAPPIELPSQHDRAERIYRQTVEDAELYSRHFAGAFQESTWSWRIPTTERFAGPIASNLSFPALIIGNTYDNICPLENAQVLRKAIKDSRLIQQDTAGHCSVAVTSFCTANLVKEYFDQGKLPEDGIICPGSEQPFSQVALSSSEVATALANVHDAVAML